MSIDRGMDKGVIQHILGFPIWGQQLPRSGFSRSKCMCMLGCWPLSSSGGLFGKCEPGLGKWSLQRYESSD